MEKWIQEIVKTEKEKRKIPLEVKISATGIPYLYHSTTSWDKKSKKCKKVSKYIGKITHKGLLEKGKAPKHSVYSYGDVRFLHDIAAKYLRGPLNTCFPEYADAIEAIAIMKVLRDIPIKQMSLFWEKQYLSLEKSPALSPTSVSEMYRKIGQNIKNQHQFYSHFIKKDHYYAFDLSCIFSESEKIKLAEDGYNPNDIKSRQINLVLLHSITENSPAILKPIGGSIREIKTLRKQLEYFDMSKIKLIIDRGHASYDLATDLHNEKLSFVMPLRRNFDIINYKLALNNYFTYHERGIRWSKDQTQYGDLFLFEDVKLRAEEESNYIKGVENGEKKVSDINKSKKMFGKIAILTNLKTDGRSLYLDYKTRECVETAFDTLKNQLEIDKTYLQTDDAINGYFFVVFNSLFLYYKVLTMIQKAEMNSKVSVSDLILCLSKVYMIDYGSKWILSEVPKKVEDYLRKMDINPCDIFPINLRS